MHSHHERQQRFSQSLALSKQWADHLALGEVLPVPLGVVTLVAEVLEALVVVALVAEVLEALVVVTLVAEVLDADSPSREPSPPDCGGDGPRDGEFGGGGPRRSGGGGSRDDSYSLAQRGGEEKLIPDIPVYWARNPLMEPLAHHHGAKVGNEIYEVQGTRQMTVLQTKARCHWRYGL